MKDLYQYLACSKQGHHQWLKRQNTLLDKWLLLDPILAHWRSNHPCMSLKKLYRVLKPDFIGRDKFIDYGMKRGFEAFRYAKTPKTTLPGTQKTYPNLLVDLPIIDINQVWVSDTTYFKVNDEWQYLTFIMDLYSRRIVGYHAASNLLTQANLETLKVSLNQRDISNFQEQLIHHSDRGSQYKSLDYTNALTGAGIRISMGRIVYDNIHIERMHQTIKGEYPIHRNIRNKKDLDKHLAKSVRFYNEQRPHTSLKMRTPIEFERYICNLPLSQRAAMKVFALKTADKSNKVKESENSIQLKLPF